MFSVINRVAAETADNFEIGVVIVKTDIEIAQGTQMQPIREVAHRAGIDENWLELYASTRLRFPLS